MLFCAAGKSSMAMQIEQIYMACFFDLSTMKNGIIYVDHYSPATHGKIPESHEWTPTAIWKSFEGQKEFSQPFDLMGSSFLTNPGMFWTPSGQIWTEQPAGFHVCHNQVALEAQHHWEVIGIYGFPPFTVLNNPSQSKKKTFQLFKIPSGNLT